GVHVFAVLVLVADDAPRRAGGGGLLGSGRRGQAQARPGVAGVDAGGRRGGVEAGAQPALVVGERGLGGALQRGGRDAGAAVAGHDAQQRNGFGGAGCAGSGNTANVAGQGCDPSRRVAVLGAASEVRVRCGTAFLGGSLTASQPDIAKSRA